MEFVVARIGAWLLLHGDLLLPLIAAHLVAAFPCQPGPWVERKRERRLHPVLWLHAGVDALVGYLFLARWDQLWLLPYLWIGHALIDAIKSRDDRSAWVFVGDQGLHLIHLIGAVLLLRGTSPGEFVWLSGNGWLLLIAILVNWFFAGVLLSKATSAWRDQLDHSSGEELDRAGLWIGRLERVLTLIFILAGHPTAVALLITAKSIFRFASRDGGGSRKESEYFLVGTLGSLTIAILTGLLVVKLGGAL